MALLNPHIMALAATIISTFFYLLYSICIAYNPHLMFKWHMPMTHIANYEKNLGDFKVTAHGFFIGLTQIVLQTYVTIWLVLWLYNYLLINMSPL